MKKLTEKEKIQIKKRYKGSWQSILNLSFDFRVSPNMIGFLVNHRGTRDKTLAKNKEWRKEHPNYMAEKSKIYYEKNKEKLKENARIRYWKLKRKQH